MYLDKFVCVNKIKTEIVIVEKFIVLIVNNNYFNYNYKLLLIPK